MNGYDVSIHTRKLHFDLSSSSVVLMVPLMVSLFPVGVPAVVTMLALPNLITGDGVPLVEAVKTLEDRGAAAVGINCSRGPDSALPVIKEIRKVCKVCV